MPFEEEEKQKLIEETHAIVSVRGPRLTNIVEVRVHPWTLLPAPNMPPTCAHLFERLSAPPIHGGRTDGGPDSRAVDTMHAPPSLFPTAPSFSPPPQFRQYKIIYRRYAGLFFCLCVDVNDNDLGYMEAIHNFVECLNEFFTDVCELDLLFNFYKVYALVDEMFLAGEIQETSPRKVPPPQYPPSVVWAGGGCVAFLKRDASYGLTGSRFTLCLVAFLSRCSTGWSC